ncbi:hypothetical protein CONLIGDRAFT_201304 [Coniochaeta ligniaria NRRL 30616]|uniref:Serine/threonine-protein kinase ppk6 n=1 Tax=Coniochaeta ligniaria NRRL 30616 TaxID=1408157 RepID=A0A1J7K1B4_9PEZI|nr:hypothetical protein CONLIGDRAFT_201304 [Coniochaeta ligniaria NRRL 30616]
MSADLFALFDAPPVQVPTRPRQNAASSATTDPFSFLQPTTAPAAEDEDDGWGDFETPAQTAAPKPAPASVISSVRPTTRIVRAPTIDLMTNNLLSLDASPRNPVTLGELTERPSWESTTRQSTESRPKNPDPNVLFDADDFDEGALPDEEDDDDFGDFEAAAPVQPPAQSSLDLLSASFAPQPLQARQAPPSQLLSTLSLNDASSTYPQPPKSPSFQERNPFPGLGLKTPISPEFPKQAKPGSPSPITAWPTFEKGDETKPAAEKNSFEAEWGAFDDIPPSVTVQPQVPNPMTTTTSEQPPTDPDWAWDDWGKPADTPEPQPQSQPQPQPQSQPPNPASKPTPSPGPPPINIPPPSILLSIFPSLLSTAATSLFKPTASASAATKSRILSSPSTQTFLRGYLALATVAARLIAGRRLRWHRDAFLSQSMTISAATGKKGGMKLATIDKSQTAREDREAADVVAAWGEVVGRLRGVVAGANAAVAKDGVGGGRALKVPELGGGLRVETVRGALTAPRACVVCGLRREERVVGVDGGVEDSFGEWWVEFWGHRECRNFWVEHEGELRSR